LVTKTGADWQSLKMSREFDHELEMLGFIAKKR
jgi:hypothetical protein